VIRPGDIGEERNMASTYKERLFKEIEGFPEKKIPKLYPPTQKTTAYGRG
jgi:hypothetical protein